MKTLLAYFLVLFCLASWLQGQSVVAKVRSVDAEHRTFTLIEVESDQTLEDPLVVRVSDGDLLVGYEGKRIRGVLNTSDGRLWLESILPVYPEGEKAMQSINALLRSDTATKQRREFRKEGDYSINFAMFNQNAEIVQFDQFKGKWIIMNFIFTRCRMPEMCPAQSARMVKLQGMAKEKGIDNLQQLSVSFDPTYDTPGIFSQYAKVKGADTRTFYFLTGEKDVMMDLLKQYGVIAFDSKNIIDHTVTTLLFDRTGKIVLRRDGTQWDAGDFIDRILKEEHPDSSN